LHAPTFCRKISAFTGPSRVALVGKAIPTRLLDVLYLGTWRILSTNGGLSVPPAIALRTARNCYLIRRTTNHISKVTPSTCFRPCHVQARALISANEVNSRVILPYERGLDWGVGVSVHCSMELRCVYDSLAPATVSLVTSHSWSVWETSWQRLLVMLLRVIEASREPARMCLGIALSRAAQKDAARESGEKN
jgi:hypothetical protein